MESTRPILLIALLVSLAVHAAGLGVAMAWYQYLAHPNGAPPQPTEIVVMLEDEPKPPPQPTAQRDNHDEMGDAAGSGIGSNGSPGRKPLQAREADADQALLSRDALSPDRILGQRFQPADSPGQNGQGGPVAIAVATPPIESASLPVPRLPQAPHPPQPQLSPPPNPVELDPIVNDKDAAIALEPKPKLPQLPALARVAAPAVTVTSAVKPAAQVAPAQPASGDGRRPGHPHAPALSLPASDSDSDPFSRISFKAEFRDGKLDVRQGRKVKTKAPHILIAGEIDQIAIADPRVVLQIHIAPSGNVTDVSITRSSGSNQIDEPTRLCVYDWWFEPARNLAGQAIEDVVFFEIDFR